MKLNIRNIYFCPPVIATKSSTAAASTGYDPCVLVCSWSSSHIRWGQAFRLRHLSTGHYLALSEDRGLVLQDREKSDTTSTAFCFRPSKVGPLLWDRETVSARINGVHDSGGSRDVLWFRDGGMEEQTGSRAGGHRGENIEVLFRGDRGGIVNISSRMLR